MNSVKQQLDASTDEQVNLASVSNSQPLLGIGETGKMPIPQQTGKMPTLQEKSDRFFLL